MSKKRWIVLICAVACATAATLGIEEYRIHHLRRQIVAASLQSDWVAARLTIQFDKGRPVWYYDRFDPSQAFFINHLQQVYMVTDPNGRILERSKSFDQLPTKPPRSGSSSDPLIWEAAKPSESGTDHYILCTGSVRDEEGRAYQLTVGRLLD